VAIKAARLYHRDRWRVSPRRRLRWVDRVPLDRPIFFLGVQGAGETLIGRCLRRNRVVVSMSGNADHWTGIDELGIVRNRMARLPDSLLGCRHRRDLDHPVFGSEHNSAYASDALLPLYRSRPADVDEAAGRRFRRLLREHIAVYAHGPWRARFFDKTHTFTLKLPLLTAYLEGCNPYFVLVGRNPYSWCYRAVRRKPPSYRVVLSSAERLRHAAEHWANSYRIALEDAARLRAPLAVVRLEDFVADAETTVRRLCDALELEFEPGMVPQPGQRLPFATLPGDRKWYPLVEDEWLGRVTDEGAAIVESVCEPLAEQLGYRRGGSTVAPTGSAAGHSPL